MTLIEELKALVEKYGYDPKNGGLDKEMNEAADDGAIKEDTNMIEEEEEKEACDHSCSGNCRREGCNCKCGEWHEEIEA